ncbi:MAG: pantetheine-phosphate adenylyltransferase [Promethearchaeota archaeon]
MLNIVGIGGTFDHLHKGHKFLIKTALDISHKVFIGLTTEKMLNHKKYASKLEDYKTRENNLKNFIKSIADTKRVEIIELNDPYGPPIVDPNYEGIVVSQETYPTALKINEIRESKGFKSLIIIVIPLIKSKNNKTISSTTIREKLD